MFARLAEVSAAANHQAVTVIQPDVELRLLIASFELYVAHLE